MHIGNNMHIGNRQFLASLASRHPQHFRRARVLELGSLNINGSARLHFEDCLEYVGIDKLAGPDVDIVVEAKNTLFVADHFDTLVCMSMVEHDPEWRESLGHNLQWLRPGGLFVLCWGAEGNVRHEPEPWAIVPFAEMKAYLETLPLEDIDVFFERERHAGDCPGAADAVAWKRAAG